MRRARLISICCLLFCAATTASAQANLFDHIYWQATGNHSNQQFGFSGIDTLGSLTDSIHQALSIGSDSGGSFVYNRFPVDTLRHFTFPQTNVRRCNWNGDPFPDYVSWGGNGEIYVLLGTPMIDSFTQAFSLNFGSSGFGRDPAVLIVDCDSDSYDDLVVSDGSDEFVRGKLHYYRGGPQVDSIEDDSLIGVYNYNYLNGQWGVGNIRGGSAQYLVNARFNERPSGSDTIYVTLFPLGPGFKLRPQDTVRCLFDPLHSYSNGFTILDADGDGVADILLGNSVKVLVYSGGPTITEHPTHVLTKPSTTPSGTFGNQIVDVGDVSGNGKHKLLITDPQDDEAGGFLGGTVFLFEIGKGIKDSCVAIARRDGFENYFGTRVAALGDVSRDKRADFAIGYNCDNLPVANVGGMMVIMGDSSYGTPSGLREEGRLSLSGFRLDQNFPNPFTKYTDVTFAVSDPTLSGKELSLKIYDAGGRLRLTAFRGTVDGFGYTVRVVAGALPSGEYWCTLASGTVQRSRRMTLVR